MDYFYEVYDDVEGLTWYFKSTKALEEFVRRRIVEHQANMEEYMADFENFRRRTRQEKEELSNLVVQGKPGAALGHRRHDHPLATGKKRFLVLGCRRV